MDHESEEYGRHLEVLLAEFIRNGDTENAAKMRAIIADRMKTLWELKQMDSIENMIPKGK